MNTFDLRVSLGDLLAKGVIVRDEEEYQKSKRVIYRSGHGYHVRIEYFDFNYDTVQSIEVIDDILDVDVINEFGFDTTHEVADLTVYNIRVSKALDQSEFGG